MKVLVAYASTHGSTAEIASRIADTLNVAHVGVDLRHVSDVSDLTGYDAVVAGSAVYFGRWLPVAEQFAAHFSSALQSLPVWAFSSGPVAAGDLRGIDAAVVDELVHATGALEHVVFAGRLSGDALTWRELSTSDTPPSGGSGDFRAWTEIEAWAQRIGRRLFTVDSQAGGSIHRVALRAVTEADPGPTTPDERHLVSSAARLAPSIDAIPPQAVTFQPNGAVAVRALAGRALAASGQPHPGVVGRDDLVSCGAAIEFARLAIRGMGRAAHVTVFPDADQPDLVARVLPAGSCSSGADDRVLVSAMTHHSHDDPPATLPPLLIDELRAAAERYGLYVRCIESPADTAIVTAALSDARLRRVMTGATTFRADDAAVRPGNWRPPDWPQNLTSDWSMRDEPRPLAPAGATPGTLILVVGNDDKPSTHVATGRAVAWMLLRIASEGLVSDPFGEATADPAFRDLLSHELRLIGHAQFLLRLPYPAAGRPTANPATPAAAGARR